MPNKKDDLPYFPFYIGDWRKATDVQALPRDVQYTWLDMLFYMWESSERGYLTINGKPIGTEALARMMKIDRDLLEQNLKHLSDFAIYSIRESDGAIYCRKMVKDQQIRISRQKAGSIGGKRSFASHFAQAKTQANAEDEIDIESENESKDQKIRTKSNVQELEPAEGWEQILHNEWGLQIFSIPAATLMDCAQFSKQYGKERLLYAITEARQRSAMNMKYVKAILENKGGNPTGTTKIFTNARKYQCKVCHRDIPKTIFEMTGGLCSEHEMLERAGNQSPEEIQEEISQSLNGKIVEQV